MSAVRLHIKNMVCNRCIRVVREELEKLSLPVVDVQLGYALIEMVEDCTMENIHAALVANGFELLEDDKAQTVERTKIAIVKLIRSGGMHSITINLSTYLVEIIGKDYHTLTCWFSEVEQTTLTRYVALQKVERVKELLDYGQLTLRQIAAEVGYSSVGHLSNQFKKLTGSSPSVWKGNRNPARRPLDQIK
jgi:YesN/AraC family two-component response regulator